MALGIILDIDDLLFDALATTPGRHLVNQLDPLHMPPVPRIRGADAKSMFMSIAIPAITLLVYLTMLEPFVATLENVKGAMCGGNQNFVWALDKRRIIHLSPTFGGGWEEEEQGIKSRAIQEGEDVGFGVSLGLLHQVMLRLEMAPTVLKISLINSSYVGISNNDSKMLQALSPLA